jgi:hypothetical protein
MDDLLRISKGKAIYRETGENPKAVYTGATNLAAEREAFVSDSESSVDSDCDSDSDSDVDLYSLPASSTEGAVKELLGGPDGPPLPPVPSSSSLP